MEQYLKEIAKELRLIRIELQEEGRYIREDELPSLEETKGSAVKEEKPTVAESLNQMFGR